MLVSGTGECLELYLSLTFGNFQHSYVRIFQLSSNFCGITVHDNTFFMKNREPLRVPVWIYTTVGETRLPDFVLSVVMVHLRRNSGGFDPVLHFTTVIRSSFTTETENPGLESKIIYEELQFLIRKLGALGA